MQENLERIWTVGMLEYVDKRLDMAIEGIQIQIQNSISIIFLILTINENH